MAVLVDNENCDPVVLSNQYELSLWKKRQFYWCKKKSLSNKSMTTSNPTCKIQFSLFQFQLSLWDEYTTKFKMKIDKKRFLETTGYVNFSSDCAIKLTEEGIHHKVKISIKLFI